MVFILNKKKDGLVSNFGIIRKQILKLQIIKKHQKNNLLKNY